jgi:hypothetical protein
MAHNLTETDTYTANVSVPDGADNRTAASVETPFQALTNRAKYLYTRLTKLSGFYSDGTYQLDLSHGVSTCLADPAWFWVDTLWYANGDSQYLTIPIDSSVLPHGATLTGFAARVNPGVARATTGNRVQFAAYKISSAGVWAIIGTGTYDDGTTTEQTVTKAGLTEVIDRNSYSYALRVTSGNDGSANHDTVLAASIARTL